MFEIVVNNKKVLVKIEKRKNLKHCYLRVLKPDLVEIKADRYFTISDGKYLVQKKFSWIEKIINKLEKNKLKIDEFYYLGDIKKLSDFNIEDIDTFYKEEIKNYVLPFVEEYSKKMQLFPSSIKFRKNKRTWGSCNFKNGLNFNYLLMKYPIDIMEYIVIHELAHIKFKNHSKDFWKLVEFYSPNYKKIEKKFKTLL